MPGNSLTLPKVLLMGLRRSGKSSIQKVVFEGMPPHESNNLATTVRPEKCTVHSNDFVNFEVWDFPGQSNPFDPDSANHYDVSTLLENCGAIVYVLDCREFIDDAYKRLCQTICTSGKLKPDLCIEVFIHKVDALSEDHQTDLLRSLQRSVTETAKQQLDGMQLPHLNFNLTSIYDHSIFQAFSKVVREMMKAKTQYITDQLQMMNTNSNIDLSYLFLSNTKIYLAADERNRSKLRTYDLCIDAIEVVVSMKRVYMRRPTPEGTVSGGKDAPADLSRGLATVNGAVTRTASVSSETADFIVSDACKGSSAVVYLSEKNCIYVRELPNSLTLVLMMPQKALENRALIDRNVDTFHKAAISIFNASSYAR